MLLWLFRFFAGFVLAVVTWFNLQPWIEVGHWIAAMGMELPFASALINLWVIGRFIEFILIHTASIVTLCLWLTIQTLQVMALLADSDQTRAQFARIFQGFPLSSWVVDNAKALGRLGWGAYGVEAVVCFLAYPPYGFGMEDFLMDWGFWDPDLWDFWAILTICITVLMFEAAVIGICFFSGLFTPTRSARGAQ